MSRRLVFDAVLLLIALGALALRLHDLGRRPMHGDEAVHASKLNTLWTQHRYIYDPHEYHGPTLYYATLPLLWLADISDWTEVSAGGLRMMPVFFGCGLIILLLLVADGLGRGPALVAAVLTAVSPALSFYSRYYIQESLLVFFTFLVLAAGWRYAHTGRGGWLLVAGMGVGLMHATKETSLIAWAALLGAAVATGTCTRPVRSRAPDARVYEPVPAILGALLLAALTSTTLMTNLWDHPRAALDSVRTYADYFARAAGGVHTHPWWYYFDRLLYVHDAPGPTWSEGLILGLGALGIAAGLSRRSPVGHPRFVFFLAAYTLLLTLFYAAIPYKTPWCALGFLHGFVLLSGVGAAVLLRLCERSFVALAFVMVGLVAAVVQLGHQSWLANHRFCADVRNPYVYAHPVSDVERLARYLAQLDALHPEPRGLLVKVMSRNPWPLPWYLRRLERVGYWEGVPDDSDADVLVVSTNFDEAVPPRLRREYHASFYGLRRDEQLVVYVHRPLRQAYERMLTASAPRGRR